MAPWRHLTWNRIGVLNLAPGRAYLPFALTNGERGPPDLAGRSTAVLHGQVNSQG
jgi:hypothetical protein